MVRKSSFSKPVAVSGVLLVAAVISSCRFVQDDATRGTGPTVDSWALTTSPAFMVSSVAIDSDSVFLGGLPLGAFTPSGDIVTAVTQGDARIIYIDSLGSALAVLGRLGQGPGEFRSITGLFTAGDTVAVWDPGARRLSLFLRRVPVRELSLPLPRSQALVGLLDDGTIVATPQPGMSESLTQLFPDDVLREGDTRRYYVLDGTGQAVQTLPGPTEPSPPYLQLEPLDQAAPRIRMEVGTWGCLPITMHRVVNGSLIIADAARGELSSISRSGANELLYRSGHRDRVSVALVQMIDESIRNNEERYGPLSSESRNMARSRLGPVGDTLPVIWSDMVVDIQGGVWLQRAACSSIVEGAAATTWEVVNSEGELVATVEVPREIVILSVDGFRVLASVNDPLGVQHLALYHVER